VLNGMPEPLSESCALCDTRPARERAIPTPLGEQPSVTCDACYDYWTSAEGQDEMLHSAVSAAERKEWSKC